MNSSFGKSWAHAAGDGGAATRLSEMDEDEALEIVTGLVLTDADEPAGAEDSPLWRRTASGRPRRTANVVLLLLESFEARLIERPSAAYVAQTPGFT